MNLNDNQSPQDIHSISAVASLKVVLLGTAAIIAGAWLTAIVLPAWLPGLASSILGDTPKVFWYLSRATALVGFILLWASMVIGLAITNRMARLWPGGPAAFDLHQYVSLLGLAFALFHGLILLGDHFIHFSIFQVLLPFAAHSYRPLWVGVGQVGFYLWAVVVGSFYVRKSIGTKTWRWIHFASFLTFALAMLHGITSGTDTHIAWAQFLYWFTGGSLLFLLYYRVLATAGVRKANRNGQRRPAGAELERS